MLASENKLSSFLTSCSTDNASVVLGASTPFKGFNIFPLFDILAGCSIHQIQLFVKDLISDIIQILEENDLSNLLTKEDLDTLIDNEGDTVNSDIKNYERLLPDNCSINIVESLVKLSMKLHSNTNWKQNFTEHVDSLPPKYCRTR